jgi:GST-like protein
MIDLYTWNTPNGRKVSIMLEEIGLPYKVFPINISKDEQFAPAFLEISPNNKIPAIVDHDNGTAMMESGAIMLYLADKTGKLMPADDKGRWKVMEWLMFQMASVGPNFGQTHHFVKYNQGKAPYAEQRFLAETKRLYGVMDKRLADHEYLAGAYSIADIATWPWTARHDWQTIDLNDYPNVKRWYVAIANRPAVRRGWDVPAKVQDIPMPA